MKKQIKKFFPRLKKIKTITTELKNPKMARTKQHPLPDFRRAPLKREKGEGFSIKTTATRINIKKRINRERTFKE